MDLADFVWGSLFAELFNYSVMAPYLFLHFLNVADALLVFVHVHVHCDRSSRAIGFVASSGSFKFLSGMPPDLLSWCVSVTTCRRD